MRRVLVSGLLAMLAAAGAGADWLVLKDGTRIETKGEWKQKGRQVQFRSADGRFQALPAGEVDLEASRRASVTPPARTNEEKLLTGEAVELPAVDPRPLPQPKLGFGDSLEAFIRDPDAPRIDPQTLPIVSESRVAMAYDKHPSLARYRQRAACAIGELGVRQIESALEQGELAGIARCYDSTYYQVSDSVDWCLSQVLEDALIQAAGGRSVDPCRPAVPRDDPGE